MARHEHLPIYKAALDLTVHLEKVVAGFSRYHKYTLGTELRQGSRAVLQQVVRANNATNAAERAAELLRLREYIESLLLTMRVGKEVQAFRSFAGYLAAGRSVMLVAQNGRMGERVMQRMPLRRWAPSAPS